MMLLLLFVCLFVVGSECSLLGFPHHMIHGEHFDDLTLGQGHICLQNTLLFIYEPECKTEVSVSSGV